MSTELFGAANINDMNGEAAGCRQLATTDYMDLLWTTLAEFPGIFATIFFIICRMCYHANNNGRVS